MLMGICHDCFRQDTHSVRYETQPVETQDNAKNPKQTMRRLLTKEWELSALVNFLYHSRLGSLPYHSTTAGSPSTSPWMTISAHDSFARGREIPCVRARIDTCQTGCSCSPDVRNRV